MAEYQYNYTVGADPTIHLGQIFVASLNPTKVEAEIVAAGHTLYHTSYDIGAGPVSISTLRLVSRSSEYDYGGAFRKASHDTVIASAGVPQSYAPDFSASSWANYYFTADKAAMEFEFDGEAEEPLKMDFHCQAVASVACTVTLELVVDDGVSTTALDGGSVTVYLDGTANDKSIIIRARSNGLDLGDKISMRVTSDTIATITTSDHTILLGV